MKRRAVELIKYVVALGVFAFLTGGPFLVALYLY